jgi:protein required for attachment to host cells
LNACTNTGDSSDEIVIFTKRKTMPTNWILVSDSSHARIFSADAPSAAMVEFEDLTHPEARLHTREITSDLPGKQRDAGPGASGSHAVEPKSDAHKHASVEFAHEVAGYLHNNLNENRYDSLVLVCEPAFLGELRNALDERVKKVVTLEVDKNLVKHSAEDIRAHLPQLLPT